ncbi:MAG: SWIM zinc finger family protein [Actinomycetota bacterium]
MARRFGSTWWGQAWIEALEQRARLDPNRLPRGRTYARQDRAAGVQSLPGEIRAAVQGSRPSPYRVRVGVRRFTDDEWDRFLGAVAARAGHAAALLDGELEPGIVEDAAAAGVELLPGPGDLDPRCSCPDWAVPCKHAAAVCYLMADELDADPFSLLALRGRSRAQVLDELRRLRSPARSAPAPVAAPTGEDTIRAAEAWKRVPAELPAPPRPRPHPGIPAVWPTDPPPDAPFTAAGLERLAADAALRAWSASRGDSTSGLTDDYETDLTRRAAHTLGTDGWRELAAAAGESPRRLARRAAAWKVGGTAGVRAQEEPPWRPDPRTMAAARSALVEAGAPPTRLRVRLNTLSVGDVQIRLATDGSWWRLRRRGGAWELDSPPASEPDDLWI